MFGLTAAGVAVLATAAGAGASIYGANKQAQANKSAQDQNIAQQDKQNNAAWTNWLMTRGITPTSPVVAGQFPGSYAASNTRLPLWANVTMGSTAPGSYGGGVRLVKRGSVQPGITGFSTAPLAGSSPAPDASASAAPAGPGGSGSGGTSNLAQRTLDPLGLTGGGKVSGGGIARNLIDPLNIFCWAAREAYGETNPKWMQFREWILLKAPDELREAYKIHAPRLAERMKADTSLRDQVRGMMDAILASAM